ncbi:tripartite tricarboxylate transporter TctB family protein [Sneathiella aquimaris]|uniref:tripartite tricarboxylate transporter TctB family protein n=1 Tax=Sneathiella aquimaris TaxID=2599305 RepID=UPI00146F3938|nr:tripartite tricarboxylate transporter TctB family protein [Sneathiella aquimaris]
MRQVSLNMAFATIVTCLALISLYVSFGYSFESSYFPRILSAFIALLGVFFLVRIQLSKPVTGQEEEDTLDLRAQGVAAATVFLGVAGYGLALAVVNFELATALFLAAFMLFLGQRNPGLIIAVSAGTTAILYGIFFEFLGVSRLESFFFQ